MADECVVRKDKPKNDLQWQSCKNLRNILREQMIVGNHKDIRKMFDTHVNITDKIDGSNVTQDYHPDDGTFGCPRGRRQILIDNQLNDIDLPPILDPLKPKIIALWDLVREHVGSDMFVEEELENFISFAKRRK